MRNISKKRLAVIAGGTAAVMAGAGIGFAYWTTSGSGTGSAGVGTNATDAALVITQTATPSGLVPGGAAQTVKVTVENTASYSQSVGEITATPTYPASCGAANWDIQPVPNVGAILAAGATSSDISVATVALKDLGVTVDQNGCKGESVSFSFTG